LIYLMAPATETILTMAGVDVGARVLETPDVAYIGSMKCLNLSLRRCRGNPSGASLSALHI